VQKQITLISGTVKLSCHKLRDLNFPLVRFKQLLYKTRTQNHLLQGQLFIPIILDNFQTLLWDGNHWQSPNILCSLLAACLNDMKKCQFYGKKQRIILWLYQECSCYVNLCTVNLTFPLYTIIIIKHVHLLLQLHFLMDMYMIKWIIHSSSWTLLNAMMWIYGPSIF
jgi:hypothetical protein